MPVAKVGSITARSIEHAQSISRSQRSTGTLGVYFSVPRFLHVNIKGGTPNTVHTATKATSLDTMKEASHGILRVGMG